MIMPAPRWGRKTYPMSNVQSVVTPASSNGVTPPMLSAKAAKAAAKAAAKVAAKAAAMASTAMTPVKALTEEEAVEIGYQYGQCMAGQDGALTQAFVAFKANDRVIGDMVQALCEGYFVRKMGYTREEAKRVIALSKYNETNPEKNTDKNRTFAQERIMVSVRMLVSRAKKMAGIGKQVNAAAAEAARARKEAETKARETRLIKADEIVNPTDTVNAFDALARLALTMKSLANKYSDKLVGDRGAAWRDWLAAAPK